MTRAAAAALYDRIYNGLLLQYTPAVAAVLADEHLQRRIRDEARK